MLLYLRVFISIDWLDEVEQNVQHNVLQTVDYIIIKLFWSHIRLI